MGHLYYFKSVFLFTTAILDFADVIFSIYRQAVGISQEQRFMEEENISQEKVFSLVY